MFTSFKVLKIDHHHNNNRVLLQSIVIMSGVTITVISLLTMFRGADIVTTEITY